MYLSDDKKEGIFQSPTRGLVEYNASSDSFSIVDRNDPRINTEELFPEPEVHTVFGDAYLLLQFLEKCGLLSVLRNVFPKDEAYERTLCHVLAEMESEVPVCKSKSLLRNSFARVNSGYRRRRLKNRTYNSKLEVTIPKRKLQNQID